MGIKLSTASDPELYNKKTNESSEIYSKYPESPEEPLTHDESRKDQFPFEMATDGPHEIMSNESQPISELRERLGRKSTLKFSTRRLVPVSRDPIESLYENKGEKIGEGSFGDVWKVVQKSTGFVRAMKKIDKRTMGKSKEPDINEVNVLKELDHPNIIKIHDINVSARKISIIMDFVTGENFHSFVTKHNHDFSEETIAKWMHGILWGVTYCHSRNVIHMDIKSDNIMFQDDSPDSILKIIDFGLSIFTSEITKLLMNQGGGIEYRAPEVFDGIISAKADVWSCGVLLYWLLSKGSFPFNGKNNQSTINFIKTADLIFPNEQWESVADGAKDLLKLMLIKDPDQRITSREAFYHPWIQWHSKDPILDLALMNDTFNRIIKFNPYLILRHAALEYISTHLSDTEDIKTIQKAFLASDKDNSGALTKSELSDMLHSLDLKNKPDVEELIENLDTDQNGLIDFSEFSTGAQDWGRSMSKSKCEAAFRAFDTNKDGVIDINELKKVLGANPTVDEETWAKILSEVDFNNDGIIQLSEFEMALTTTYLEQGTKRSNLKFPRVNI